MARQRERRPDERRARQRGAGETIPGGAPDRTLDQTPTMRYNATYGDQGFEEANPPDLATTETIRAGSVAAGAGAGEVGLDDPMTTPPTHALTVSRSAVGATGGGSQSRALVPMKSGAERDRALAQINAARAEGGVSTTLIPGARHFRQRAPHIVPRRSGPRSIITQFAVSMIVTALLISALTLTTPLGKVSALDASAPLQAYANAAPWLPTPTPKPTATPKPAISYPPAGGSNPGAQAIIADIQATFGGYASGALAIARCESGYDPNAWNPYPILNSHASGVFQILYPSTWNTTSYSGSSPFNADANIHAAYQIFQRDGYSWREWQCQP